MKMTPSLRRGAARTAFVLTLLMGAAPLLSACNTTAGFGQDVSATGNAVTTSADKVKQGL